VAVADAFSAHGDMHDLRAYALHSRAARRVFLIHGEPEQQEPLREFLVQEGLDVMVPAGGDHAALD
jgi:Cft2 family RNA processing exonuclease